MGRSDPGDQNMLKNQSDWNCSKKIHGVYLVLTIPTQLEWDQTDIVCEIYAFCPLCQIGKKMLIVQSVQSDYADRTIDMEVGPYWTHGGVLSSDDVIEDDVESGIDLVDVW
jgi:hypothetical protein